MPKLLIVHDQQIIWEGITQILLDGDPGLEIESCQKGNDIKNQIDFYNPDLMLFDISEPKHSDTDQLKTILAFFPDLKVIIIGIEAPPNFIMELLKVGIMGYISKKSSKDIILSGIKEVLNDEPFFSDDISHIVVKSLVKNSRQDHVLNNKITPLTNREKEILFLIVKGINNQSIADQLNISRRTVENHRQNIMRKVGVNNTASLINFSLKNGLV